MSIGKLKFIAWAAFIFHLIILVASLIREFTELVIFEVINLAVVICVLMYHEAVKENIRPLKQFECANNECDSEGGEID